LEDPCSSNANKKDEDLWEVPLHAAMREKQATSTKTQKTDDNDDDAVAALDLVFSAAVRVKLSLCLTKH